MKILVINPGSTSTKIAVYNDEEPLFVKNIKHNVEELAQYKEINEQLPMRKKYILEELAARDIAIDFDAVIGRGGLTRPIPAGVYRVNEQMMADTTNAMRRHACNLGCIIAHEIAAMCPNPQSFIADPGVVDEMDDVARITGMPDMPRVAIWHALNQRAIARRFAKEHGKRYEDLNLIIAHLGGGISVAAHRQGKAVDVNNALDGEGPFSPERAGSLPAADLIHLCCTGKYTENELKKMIAGKAGQVAHLGTNNGLEIENRIEAGDKQAKLIQDAMDYQVAKAICAQGAALKGKVDAIIITGGMARSKYIIDQLKDYTAWMAPFFVYPGEDEMEALALNALDVLRGELEAKTYNI